MGQGGVCWQNICYHAAAFGDSLEYDMQHDHVLKKLNFVILTPCPGSGRGQNVKYHASAFGDSLYFYMQHDHVLKKFELMTPFPGPGRGLWALLTIMLLHLVIPFNLKYKITMF